MKSKKEKYENLIRKKCFCGSPMHSKTDFYHCYNCGRNFPFTKREMKFWCNKKLEKAAMRMNLTFDAVEWSCWVEAIPILEYFCGTKRHSATKKKLLEYTQKFRLMEMVDLEERLNFLENKGLIHVFKTMIIVKWYY